MRDERDEKDRMFIEPSSSSHKWSFVMRPRSRLGTRGISGIASRLHTYPVRAKCRTRFGWCETKNPLTIGQIPMEFRRTFVPPRSRHVCPTLQQRKLNYPTDHPFILKFSFKFYILVSLDDFIISLTVVH